MIVERNKHLNQLLDSRHNGLTKVITGIRRIGKSFLIFNELCNRGYNVDVGVVPFNGKDAEGKSYRSQLEVDFVCNKGNERIYVQSVLALPTQEKIDQETNSLRRIDDGFQKIVVTGDHSLRSHDEHGILFVNIYDFLYM